MFWFGTLFMNKIVVPIHSPAANNHKMADVNDMNDSFLLREYADRQSDTAFSELVQRHLNFVYSVALRCVQNPPDAQDVAQAVFVILAKKSAALCRRTTLTGWLYEATRLTARQLLRTKTRRFAREQEAYMQSTLDGSGGEHLWHQLAPHLEAAMSRLRAADRELLALRFYEDKTSAQAAALLGIREEAARKRTHRALEKLRSYFARHGVDSTAAAIGGSISANSIQAAPVALAKAVTAVALAKGAAASASTLALVKGALKVMAWTQAKTAMVVGVGILFVAGTATVTVKELGKGDDSVNEQVLKIIRTNNWGYFEDNNELDQLIAIGPKTIPVLSNLVVWREPTTLRPDEKFFASLPSIERRHFQDLLVRRQMHQKAVQIVCELGPVAARPLSSALCGVLDDTDRPVTTYAMRVLYWSIPESTNAVAAATNWLADPARQHIFGLWDAESLWTNVPQTVPLLAQCLRNPYLAAEAAQSLGFFGTNALAAVPNLIEVCDQGVAEPPLELNFKVSYTSPDDPQLMNRHVAFDALGKIGDASPEVLAVINRGLTDANEEIRFAALRSLAALHQPLTGRLGDILNTFAARRNVKFGGIIDWTGTLRADGLEALPWLNQFVTLDNVRKLPARAQNNTDDFAVDAEDIRFSAIMAICRLKPEAIRQYLPDLIAQIGRHWEEVNLLTDSKSLAPDIVSNLEPMLSDTNQPRSAIAAYIVLGLEPEHARALATLRNCVTHGALVGRVCASEWLWKRTGETNDVLPLCVEGLASQQSGPGQDAASILDDLGQLGLREHAAPARAELRAALRRSSSHAAHRLPQPD